MPRFYGTLSHLVVKPNFTKTVDSAIKNLLKEATRAWLKAVILHVPVWTGFAKGSIKFARGQEGTLATYLRVAVPISPVSEYPKNYFHTWKIKKIPKRPELAGTFAYYKFSATRHVYRFTFNNKTVHYILGEWYDMPNMKTAPWKSLLAGKKAFKRQIVAGIRKLPKIQEALLRMVIPIGK